MQKEYFTLRRDEKTTPNLDVELLSGELFFQK